ncbi:MAG: hypothetical protein RLZZ436_4055 [Planctomycetota bacterium]
MAVIAVAGTLDTKGPDHAFVADCIRSHGFEPLLIDWGTQHPPTVTPQISRAEVAAAGGIDLATLSARGDRGECVAAMAAAAPALLSKLHTTGRISGVISLGGSSGTAIAAAAMRVLPIGFPKLIVSTMASGNIAPYVGTRDITVMPSVVDVAGLNQISRVIYSRAAGAICGMAAVSPPAAGARPVVVASMFGNTTACINEARRLLEEAGCEVLVFHANGAGGRTMEALIDNGLAAGVLDLTTTELADELAGGVLTAGPDRLTAAARRGVPAVVGPGCLDMVNFGEPTSIPGKYREREFYAHNPQVTLMRTTPEECVRLGLQLAEKVNASTGPVTVLLPLQGISVISAPGGPFHDPHADAALFTAIAQNLREGVRLQALNCAINDPQYAAACVQALLEAMRKP